MHTGRHHLVEFLEFTNLEQFIVPEIQRDYVWQKDNILDLLNTFKEGFDDENGDVPYLGFIYAFKDKEYAYRYFLVDGQQRMTSVYLLLLIGYHKTGKKLPFYLVKDNKLKLDYKVRQATHDFLADLVSHCQLNPFSPNLVIRDQVWFHRTYENDMSICNIISNYEAIRLWLEQFDQPLLLKFLKFLEDKVELSYFDIEDGREGEELYIYMNSRGRQLEINETIKARFLAQLPSPKDHLEWGRKWEHWQDFFWMHRGKNPDADATFNEFLRQAQIIQMCILNKKAEDISKFATGKGEEFVSMELLPVINEVEAYFEAFEWMVGSTAIAAFYDKHGFEKFLTTSPYGDRRQVYYFRILPILVFLSKSGCRDEIVVVRFMRFFYNISRKTNVGKDISSQFPIAIKLVIQYCKDKQCGFDVSDLIEYTKGRKVLIDEEEIVKLKLYKAPPSGSTREELEDLFNTAEDHEIFSGEIQFLFSGYYDKDSSQLDLNQCKKTWNAFRQLFVGSKENDGLVARALLYPTIIWTQDTPYYYNNYDTQDWFTLVRGDSSKYLMALLEEMHDRQISYLDIIIRRRMADFFHKLKYTSVSAVQSAETVWDQVKILAAIDYYADKKLWLTYNRYIAEDHRYHSITFGDKPFFTTDRVLYNIRRYVQDGWTGRILDTLSGTLQNVPKLDLLVKQIIEFNEKATLVL